MTVTERFLRYIQMYTTSDSSTGTVPSTDRQKVLGRMLAEELRELGLADAFLDEKGYVYGHLPAKDCTNGGTLGLIAHVDTAPDFNGENVRPQIIENYNGEDVKLGDSGRILSRAMFPHLPKLAGKTLITTDGTTLLGGDDKAGIAEIMTVLEELQKTGRPHPALAIAFTPDEEIGTSADHFDVKTFGAPYAYTVDGGRADEIVYENFNAASADVVIHGVNIHPGSAKNTMVNACLAAMEFNAMLPAGDIPARTSGYEGFYHLCDMTGDVEEARLSYIVRDHDAAMFEARLYTLRHAADCLNEKYGEGTVELTVRESYRNMAEKVREAWHLVEKASAAIRKAGMEPSTQPIRGGTDGARLSFMGVPCPNLGTGTMACHGPYEHITAEAMEDCVRVILGIVDEYTK